MTLVLEGIDLRRGGRAVLQQVATRPFQPGEFVVLAGPNGAGKSSLLHGIAQILPYRGRITYQARDLASIARNERADLIGFMPQNAQSRTDLSVLDSLVVAMNAGGTLQYCRAEQIARAEMLLGRFGCAHLAHRGLSALSGGQRQLVGLAMAMAREPQLVLLDEPTAALDLSMQFRVLREIRDLAREGRIVIAVLHDLTQAARWADRLVILSGGSITADGAPAAVLTPQVLARVYGVAARIERDSRGNLTVCVDGPVDA